jgi:hypothetical protein
VLLNLPYLRLMQEVRLASERELAEQRAALQNAAFIGWQVRDIVMSAMGAKTRPQFTQYLTSLGLSEGKQRRKTTALAPRGTGSANANKVREAFKRGGARKAKA